MMDRFWLACSSSRMGENRGEKQNKKTAPTVQVIHDTTIPDIFYAGKATKSCLLLLAYFFFLHLSLCVLNFKNQLKFQSVHLDTLFHAPATNILNT